jgi:PPOX class probable F420-dependent enzyme
MLNEAQRAVLNGRHYGVVGTLNADGSIQQTLIWYILEDDQIRFGLGAQSVKARNLRRSPQITLTVQVDNRYLTVSGTATVEPPDNAMRRRIAARYLPAEQLEAWLARPTSFERASVRMAISRVYGQGV